MSARKRIQTLYAVVRLDGDQLHEGTITVKEVVSTLEEAEAEVERLNALAAGRDKRYFWQTTRHVRTGSSPAE
jgi:hypothetical protein